MSPQTPTSADWNPGQDYHRHNGFFQSNLRLDYSLGSNLTLTSITSFSRYTEHQLQDIDGTTLSNLTLPGAAFFRERNLRVRRWDQNRKVLRTMAAGATFIS